MTAYKLLAMGEVCEPETMGEWDVDDLSEAHELGAELVEACEVAGTWPDKCKAVLVDEQGRFWTYTWMWEEGAGLILG